MGRGSHESLIQKEVFSWALFLFPIMAKAWSWADVKMEKTVVEISDLIGCLQCLVYTLSPCNTKTLVYLASELKKITTSLRALRGFVIDDNNGEEDEE